MLSIAHSQLKDRCTKAAANEFSIGKAETYVADLQAVVGVPALPPGVVKNSPQHILFLLDMMDQGRRAPAKPKVVEPEPERPAKKKGK